jgi:tetratricopeptide (TPR) repeat protein
VTLSNLAQVYLYQEDWSKARQMLQESEEIFAEIGSDDYLSELERRWGEYYLGIGNTEQALNHTKCSLELAEEKEAPIDMGMTLRVLGEIYTQIEDYDQAEKALAKSFSTLHELGSEYEAAKTMLTLNRLSLKRGMAAKQDQIEYAIQIFEKLGARADFINAQSLANRLS